MYMFFRNIFVGLVGFVLVVFSTAEDVKVLKKHSFYNTTREEVILNGVNLQEIEVEAFKDVTVQLIIINTNPLEKLRKGIFTNVSTHDVDLYDNDISTIEPGTFHEFHPLDSRGIMVLSLAYNKLESIRKGIFNNTKFRKLYLFYNKIKYIEPGSFDGMIYLFDVDLRHNLLERIDTGVFQNLATRTSWVDLNFSQNNIKFIDPYAFENTTVYTLDLQDNQLEPLNLNYFKRTNIGTFLA